MKIFLNIFKKSTLPAQKAVTSNESLKKKYSSFQELLRKNNDVLELMAELEEKRSGQYDVDRRHIVNCLRLLSDDVLNIIKNLNSLSGDKYQQLYTIHHDIDKEIRKILEYKAQIPVSDLVIPLENLEATMVNIAGGKCAHLGETTHLPDFLVPPGFSISAYGFLKFMEHNNFVEKINAKISVLDAENLVEITAVGKELCDMILTANIPPDLEHAIMHAYTDLNRKTGEETVVSVRSSAIHEDSEYSFAGQYATFLNVPGPMILQKYREVVASLFSPGAIIYHKRTGFSQADMVMAVGILRMINAVAGGVMYSRDPNDPSSDYMIINAVHGLGKWVVDGTVTPDTYIVSRHPEGLIIDKKISDQEKMLVCGKPGELQEVIVPDEKRGRQCITDRQIRMLAGYALDLEKHYGAPQDIEWVIDSDNMAYILQTRPLRIFTVPVVDGCLPARIEGYNILIDKGVTACNGVGSGRAFILESEEKLKDLPEGAVLVARQTSPSFVTVMEKASAIITDMGSATGHIASLSREYKVPTILDTAVSTRIIKDGMEITVDAGNCIIYEGRVDELLEYSGQKKASLKETPLVKTFERIMQWVAPLNLIDPGDENFRPEYCQTFHDITRFAHQKAMQEMFNIAEGYDFKGAHAVSLSAGIPVDIQILDIDGGIRENVGKVSPGDILSLPFSACLKGMRKMKWPEMGSADAGKSSGVTALAATVPEELPHAAGERNFCIVSRNYMNFSIKLGYHFSTIEAYAGDNVNDNYIKFFFKGGGASPDRRLRRVRLITEILKTLGFRINVKEDILDAILTQYNRPALEDILETVGKLTAYTKQLDMVLFNDAVTDMYVETFIKEHVTS